MSLFDDYLESVQASNSNDNNNNKSNDILNKNEELTVMSKNMKKATGYIAVGSYEHGDPMFSLQYVQFQLPDTLVDLAVQNNILAAILDNFRIIRIDLDNPLEVDMVEISRKSTSNKAIKLFLDPTGRHIIVTSSNGENYYLFHKWRRTKELSKLRDITITSIAWNKYVSPSSPTTGEILVGTNTGIVYETCIEPTDEFFKREEKYMTKVFSLNEPSMPITGLQFERFPTDHQKYFVMLSTPSRLYHFTGFINTDGDKTLFACLFSNYEDHPEFQELPSDLNYSRMLFFNRFPELQMEGVPQVFAWLIGVGIYYGHLSFNEKDDHLLNDANLIPFPPTTYDENTDTLITDQPISFIITEFHFVLLYKRYVRAMCRLSDKIVYEEMIPLNQDEVVRGMTVDDIKRTYWIYTSDAIYELVIHDEERDVWKLYLQKKEYAMALQYCKEPSQRTQVYTAQAQEDFEQHRYMESAKYFAQSAVPFEEVALKFTKKKERDALRFFLISRLEQFDSNDRTQKTLIATWLVELYLQKMNQLEEITASINFTNNSNKKMNSHYKDELQDIKDEFYTFLETFGHCLHIPTTYKLISRHGFNSELLNFASYIGDHEKIIEHWISEKNWERVIKALDGQNNLELFYKFSTPLMENIPEKTVDVWINYPKLNPRYLIPALLRYNHSNKNSENQAIRYLFYVVSVLGNKDPVIHNFLLTLYATQPTDDETALLTFLKNEGREMHYKLDYALRICSQNGRTQSCVHLYSQMGLFEEAVNLALEHHNLNLAKSSADRLEDDNALRKKLWINIAKYVIQNNKNIKVAMQFLKKCDLLKIEDILPFFPDYVLIDDFKDEICSALEEYNISIEELKVEMDEATSSAEHIRIDVRKLRKRFSIIDKEQTCYLCKFPLLTRQFYVFSCNHEYHVDCLRNRVAKDLPTRQIKKLADIQEQLSHEFKLVRTLQTMDEEKEIALRIDELRHQFDHIIANQCVMCGDIMINSIDVPFIGEDEADVAASWVI
ncbi:Pep3/Vps18/deep orange family-domain-containing protein [Cokeromyces recurvatus]|uniref:Pep3/Vps18/deep orange family-domain-containing protein n=1 Tax=Cokeromyces recurvatus TaxID=90255 RepID=UPI00221E578C|nr:Pep3/Vps18/deep orange family-domain-containing protein [Cokeromyces recurvatus]KAI7903291.1 Pep3/Vps18/deep orange family-domain-containing protein [Cokeromyces recurvatus]